MKKILAAVICIAISAGLFYAKPVTRSQVAITICGDMQKTFEGDGKDY